MNGSEKRRIQRLNLDRPIEASLSGLRVMLLDISTAGARVEHSFPMKASRQVKLDFLHDGATISLQCDIVRCRLQKSGLNGAIVYQSGLRFSDPAEESRLTVRELVASLVNGRIRGSESGFSQSSAQ